MNLKERKALIKILLVMENDNEEFKNVLFNRSYMRREMNRTQSKLYNREQYRINKLFLSSYDDKEYILKDG